MKVLLVNGSPHKNGCTHTALNIVADVLHEEGIETEEFWIGIKPIGGCIGCHQCDKRHDCIFDDVVNVFRKKAQEADGFLFGSPVHYAALGGNMKILWTAFFIRKRVATATKGSISNRQRLSSVPAGRELQRPLMK